MAFLGIDVGSSSVKGQTIDDKGRQIEFATFDVTSLLRRPQPTWAERDGPALWESVCAMLRSMKNLGEVEALSVDATSGSVLAVDKNLRPLSPILLYSDKRAQKEASYVGEKSAEARTYEPYLPLDASLATPKILWLKRHMQNFSEVEAIINEADYIQAKLTGIVCTSPSVAGKAHVDVRSGKYLQQVFQDIGIEIALLPQIQPIGHILGEVTESASLKTGIARNAQVANGLTDATAADLATGTLVEGQVNISIGTSLVAHAVARRALPDHEKRIYYKAYVDGLVLAGGATDAGTLPLTNLARLLGKSVQELNILAAAVPLTCEGLLAQPQWIGSRIPQHNPRVRGFFVGVTEQTLTPGYLYRSLLEGNAFVVKQVLDVVQTVTGLDPQELRTSGGGSNSELQNRIIADVTGKTVLAIRASEASLGTAMLALHSQDEKQSLADIAKRVTKIRERFTPSKDAHQIYAEALPRFTSINEDLFGGR
jgi:sugar (pentulose or hexulose) kinase